MVWRDTVRERRRSELQRKREIDKTEGGHRERERMRGISTLTKGLPP